MPLCNINNIQNVNRNKERILNKPHNRFVIYCHWRFSILPEDTLGLHWSIHCANLWKVSLTCRKPCRSLKRYSVQKFITMVYNGLDGVSNHQTHHCSLSHLFGRWSKKTSKLLVTGLCAGNSPGTGEFPAQMTSNAENAFICWRHHMCEAM